MEAVPDVSSTPRSKTLLPIAEPASLGLDPERLARLRDMVQGHISDGWYPGAQVALARHGQFAVRWTVGQASVEPEPKPASEDTLWLLWSQTKVIVVAAVWALVDRGAIRFTDKVTDHVPEFEKNGKDEITLYQLLTHQGGFPKASVPPEAWEDHELLRQSVCDFTLDWTPGTKVSYHGSSAHWVVAVLLEAVTGQDYRNFIRDEILAPVGLDNDLFVGVPADTQARCSVAHVKQDGQTKPNALNTPEWRAAGVPGFGGYGTAAGMAAFYQMLLAGGVLDGVRVLSPRVIQFATRNHTGDRVDESMGMPMHRGLGPHVRGTPPTIRGLGTIASPSTFGHGGAGTSYSWADPESGVSFSYITNCGLPEPLHSIRLDKISNLAHASIIEP